MTNRLVVGLLLAFLAHATPARAQSISGRALAATDRQPIKHAFVVLLDEQGHARGGALSDSTGRWLIGAPAAGRYRLRLERIGFENITSEWVEIGNTLTIFDLIVPERPFTLDAVLANSSGRGCTVRPDAQAVYRLWEEVQKALRLTRWTETQNALTFGIMTYVRETNTDLSQVKREQSSVRTARVAAPFGTLSPAALMQQGFSQPTGDDLTLHGVDAKVLLSPEFVEHYCFRLQPSTQAGLIGLGFQPVRSRRATDVRGVLWVDRQTAELRHLSYEYFNLPGALDQFTANAEVHFRKLDTGLWVIDRWWIRAPHVQNRIGNVWSPAGTRSTIEHVGYREDGGVLMLAEDRARSFFQLVGGGALEGNVVGRPSYATGRAAVLLTGTGHSATIDAAGRFRIVGVPPGKYAVTVRDSLLDELRIPSRLDTVQLAAGHVVTRTLSWPPQPELLRALCPGEQEEVGTEMSALLYGDVLHPQTGRPLSNAKIQVSWNALDTRGGVMQERRRSGFTGSDGRYYVCWLPHPSAVIVEVTAPNVERRLRHINLLAPVQRQNVR